MSHFPDLLEEILTAIATDTWEGSAEDREEILRLCQGIPALKSELERIRAEIEPFLQWEVRLELEFKREGETQGVVQVPPGTEGVSIPGIIPGAHTLTLSTGRRVWESTILPKEVLWAEAYPSRDLELAAQPRRHLESRHVSRPCLMASWSCACTLGWKAESFN